MGELFLLKENYNRYRLASLSCPGGESAADMQRRVDHAIQKVRYRMPILKVRFFLIPDLHRSANIIENTKKEAQIREMSSSSLMGISVGFSLLDGVSFLSTLVRGNDTS